VAEIADSQSVSTTVKDIIRSVGKQLQPKDAAEIIVDSLRRCDYSIVDFLNDVRSIKSEIDRNDESHKNRSTGLELIDNVLFECIYLTSYLHETVIESTLHCYCEFDEHGTIKYSNRSLQRLMGNLDEANIYHIIGVSSSIVDGYLGSSQSNYLDCVRIRTPGGCKNILAEIGCVPGSPKSNRYAVLVDISAFVHSSLRSYEAAPFGVIKLSEDFTIIYANEAAGSILNIPITSIIGSRVSQFLNEEILSGIASSIDHSKNVMRGRQHRVEIKFPGSASSQVLRVTLFPDVSPVGTLAGVLAMIEDVGKDVASQKINEAVANFEKPGELFSSIAKIIKNLINFDRATFSIYTPDRAFSQSLYHEPSLTEVFPTRWFPLPIEWRDWIVGTNPWISDMEAEIPASAGGDELLAEPTMQQILKDGYKSCLCIPVKDGGRLVGALSLLSKDKGAYSEKEHIVLEHIGAKHAMHSVFHAYKREDQNFMVDLIKAIPQSTDHRQLAQIIVDSISMHYAFQHVSILKVNALRDRLEMLAQAVCKTGGIAVDGNYTQDLDAGLVGLAYMTGESQISGNVNSPELRGIYIEANPDTKSELCVPIKLRGRILWVINLEDRQYNAFHESAELEILSRIISEIESTLERLFDGLVLNDMVQAFPDAVMIGNIHGILLNCNERFRSLFPDTEVKRGVEIISLSPDLHKIATAKHKTTASKLLRVGDRSGKTTSVLATSYLLTEMYDHTVLVLKDISDLQWETDHQTMEAAIGEAAAHCRVPLSYASNIIRQIAKIPDIDISVVDAVDRAIQQLNRVELTYDRIVRSFSSNQITTDIVALIDLEHVVELALSELPSMSKSNILFSSTSKGIHVSASAYNLMFVVKSVIGYYIRYSTRDSPTKAYLKQENNRAVLSFVGRGAGIADIKTTLESVIEETKARVSLGEGVLIKVIERQNGTFSWFHSDDGLEEVSISLPLAESRSNGAVR
jgi:putative methionine-R-sulfoxide reductase with GAF domain